MATLGAPPLRIDIMTSITGVDFAQAWAGRRRARFGDLALLEEVAPGRRRR